MNFRGIKDKGISTTLEMQTDSNTFCASFGFLSVFKTEKYVGYLLHNSFILLNDT